MENRLLRQALKKQKELEEEIQWYKEYIAKLDKLNSEDFIFKHELEENYIPKSKIRDKIKELETLLQDVLVQTAFKDEMQYAIRVLNKIMEEK